MFFLRYNLIIYCLVLSHTMLFALKKDSVIVIKPAKHYFKTNIYTDFYSTSKRNLIGDKYVSKKQIKSLINKLSNK